MKKPSKILIFIANLLLFSFLFQGCEKNDTPGDPSNSGSEPVLVTNEGLFMGGEGTLSLFYPQSGTIDNNVFKTVNAQPLGNVLQSLKKHGDLLYFVVNNSNKIEVAQSDTYVSIASITNISLPRYIEIYNNSKAYISSMSNFVLVMDLSSYAILDTVFAGIGPEKMLIDGDILWVLNQGGYEIDNTITIVDCQSDSVLTEIKVGQKPMDIFKAKDGMIYVLCAGKGWNGYPAADDTKACFYRIDPNSFDVLQIAEFPNTDDHPEKAAFDVEKGLVYFAYPGGVYTFDVNTLRIDFNPIIQRNVVFYGLAFDPESELIYAADALDFQQPGWMYRFRSSDGTVVDSAKTGIGTNGFYF
jgi:DNA-binding beta-propeller fold protein YncE